MHQYKLIPRSTGIGKLLVRAKLYPLETPVESFKCSGKRCLVSMNVSETNVFSSSVNNKEHITNDSLNCNSTSAIQLLTCNRCKL